MGNRNEFMVHLDCVLDVEDFVAVTTPKRYPIFLDDGRRRVNGKSFMEMFSLRLNEPLRVTAQCSDEEFEALRFEAARFLYI